jgi:hypothetical protein
MSKREELAPTTKDALAPALPSNHELIQKLSDTVAKSPTTIQPGQIVLLGSDGAAWERQRFVRVVAVIKTAIWSGVIGGMVLALSGFWVAGGVLYFAGLSPALFSRYRGSGTLLAIETLARQGHLDEAQRRLDQVPELRRRNRARYAAVAGRLASHRGDHGEAVRWWHEALPRMKPGLANELLKCALVSALARSGDLVEARRVFATLQFPPRADDILVGKVLGELVIALHSKELPPVEALHDWARGALAYNHTGVELAAIGWAFDRHGVDDMASFLAREATERMHYKYLRSWWPELHEWLDARVSSARDTPSEYDL